MVFSFADLSLKKRPLSMNYLQDVLQNETAREEQLTAPRAILVEELSQLRGRLLFLGVGGKMGPTLAVLATRALRQAGSNLQILGISRFSNPASRDWLETHGVETLSADLLDPRAVASLPDAGWVISLAGRKFGTSEDPSETWAVNCLLTSHICSRYSDSKIVALSTGNVYPMVSAGGEGSLENDPLVATGEYSAAAIGRERILEYYSLHRGVNLAVVRLNYAVDLVYGVLVDIGKKVLAGEPIDLTMGYLNCIWQGDANEAILRLLSHTACPRAAFNLTGPKLGVREIALKFASHFNKEPHWANQEGPTALLSNPKKINDLLGSPFTPIDTVIRWTAQWLQGGGALLDRPTKFQAIDGKY
ncbi:MAG: NAD(P)-dependent oxidoreductase [Gemmataceae bacterium]|nr:NAD(P)-dependent oxidoreductase [Gemmataceae bacterium]